MRALIAGLVAGCVLGCEEAPSGASRAVTPVDARVDAADASDAAAPLTTFHGVEVRGWDRAMPDVDAIGYEVDLTVDASREGAETFRGALRGVFVATRPLDALALDYTGEAVEGAEVDGRAVTPSREGGTLTVPLGRTVPTGTLFTATVRYRGALSQGTGANPNDFESFGGLMVFQRNRAGRKIFASLNWPSKARRWLPVRDHPRDGAMVALRVTMPRGLTVFGNGRLERAEDVGGDARRWEFFCATPMPAYDIHVAAYDDWAETRASSRGGRELRWLPYATDRDAGTTLFEHLPAAMDFYEGAFGPFRWEHAVFLEVPIFGGGMEHATVVSMDETLFRTASRSRTVSFHELAHHWSGNLVRIATWNDFWLSEGVTDYLTGRFVESHDGAAAGLATWRSFLAAAFTSDRARARHPVRPPDPEVNVLSIFDAISYKKGAWVLRALEHRVGTAALTGFLRGWFGRHAGEAVTTATLERELAAEFPRADIPGYFRQWVYGAAFPVFEVTSRYDAAARSATLTLRQTQPGGPPEGFTLPLTLELRRGASTARATVEVTGRTTTATVPVAFDPEAVVLDPDERAYAAAACGADRPCRAGYTCASASGAEPALCMPPRL